MKRYHISYHPYSLHIAGSQRQPRHGALLRIVNEDGTAGFADCHPWIEFGAAPLHEQLGLLARGVLTPLTERTMHYAHVDAEARARKVNLFKGLQIPESHYLIVDIAATGGSMMENIVQHAPRVKIKMGIDVPAEIAYLRRWSKDCKLFGCKLRLDFNYRLSQQQFCNFLDSNEDLSECIDFIEDPFIYDSTSWSFLRSRYKVRLSCDRDAAIGLDYPESCDVVVVKPVMQDIVPFVSAKLGKRKLLFTTALDHPVGVLAAAYQAAVVADAYPDVLERCGLLAHFVYEPCVFSERLGQDGMRLVPPVGGTGFGFDDLLKELPWQPLA